MATATAYWSDAIKAVQPKPINSNINIAQKELSSTAAGALRGGWVKPNNGKLGGEQLDIAPNVPKQPDPNNNNQGSNNNVDIAPPTFMTRDEALERAKGSVLPQFSILRGRMEQQQSKEQEEMPQYLAARFGGISGLSGGMKESNQADLTQKQAQAIQDIEYQKEQTLNQTAEDIMYQTNSGALSKWQAETDAAFKKSQLDYQANRDKILDARTEQQNNLALWLQMQGWSREDARNAVNDEQWLKKYNLEANSLNNDSQYQDMQKQLLAAQLENAWSKAIGGSSGSYGRSSGSSGSSSGGYSGKSAGERENAATGDLIGSIQNMKAAGSSYREIYKWLRDNAGTFEGYGADTKKAAEYLQNIAQQLSY